MAIRFTCGNRSDNETILRVSTRALDRAFAATDPEMYALSENKIAFLMDELAGQVITAPVIGVYEGQLIFENGRHRARVALRQGVKVIPVIVEKDNVAAVRDLLKIYR
jgi:hypothetical protein